MYATLNIANEKLIRLLDAARLVPAARNGKRTHLSTLLRWILRGAKGPSGTLVKLEAIRLGNRWMTSREALQRFAERLTPAQDTAPRPMPRSMAARERAIRRAEKFLDSVGI
jgi:hypothetical protein